MPEFNTSADQARSLDEQDELKHFRDKFYLPLGTDGKPRIYFCGNSLGLQPRTVQESIEQELRDWRELAVDGHFDARHPWLPYHEFLAEPTARLVGALPSEVVVMNNLTVNLHLMMVSFYRRTSRRHKIMIESHAFPSDQYAVKSQLRFHGLNASESLVELLPDEGDILETEDILRLIEEHADSLALIMLGGVNYYTGQAFDFKTITAAGHKHDCVVGFDLAHAAGNLELSLHDWEVDFAVWCSYKYLNSGPGSIAGCYVHENHHKDPSIPRFEGWWGQDKKLRFQMGPDFHPIETVEAWQLSNPAILSMAAVRASLEVFDEAGMKRLRRKSVLLTSYLEFLIQSLKTDRVEIFTPADPNARGAQLSLRVQNGRKVFDYLARHDVVCDWREPDCVRVAPVPLYNTFEEVYLFCEVFARALEETE